MLVFEKSFNNDSNQDILDLAVQVRDFEIDDYILTVFNGVYDNLEIIDGEISDNTKNWNITRISKVALAVLRLAVFEIKFMDDIPVNVTVNEAVELAKKFAAESDASYINGVLGAITRKEA